MQVMRWSFLYIDDMKAVISGKFDDDLRNILRREKSFQKSTNKMSQRSFPILISSHLDL